jgi:hypothetical protein
VAKERIRFIITSGNLETSCSVDCQKWIRHLAASGVKAADLRMLYDGKFPGSKLFVLDMIQFLKKSDPLLDRFLAGRGGIKVDDLFSIDHDGVRQLVKSEFPELAEKFATTDSAPRIIKRRSGEVDLSPLKKIGTK